MLLMELFNTAERHHDLSLSGMLVDSVNMRVEDMLSEHSSQYKYHRGIACICDVLVY